VTLHYRRRLSLGPLRLNVTGRGLTSVALVLGPLTWNLTRRRTTVDLPGGLSWTGRKR
jgi:Protein of unknown function (DUF4236)